jgi:hypothetical protein
MLSQRHHHGQAPISNIARQPGWLRRHAAPDDCPAWLCEGQLMPRISDAFLDCVIYLYPDEASADAGEKAGGSGFLTAVPVWLQTSETERVKLAAWHVYAVTNSHVVKGGSCTIRLNDQDGNKIVYPTDEREWVSHPGGDDVAVCPVELSLKIYKLRFVETISFLTKNIMKRWSLGPGDNTFPPYPVRAGRAPLI